MVSATKNFLLHFFTFWDILSHFRKKFFLKILLLGTDHITHFVIRSVHTHNRYDNNKHIIRAGFCLMAGFCLILPITIPENIVEGQPGTLEDKLLRLRVVSSFLVLERDP